MRNLFLAELKKAFANFKLTSFLVWIFPIGIFALYLVMFLLSLLSDTLSEGALDMGSGDWTKDGFGIWGMVIFFPGNIFGRMLPLAFMAVVFAGEYHWRTWKNIIPRNHRWALILSKMLALTVLVMISMAISALLTTLGPYLGHILYGEPYGPSLSWDVLANLTLDHGRYALIVMLSLIILSTYGAISALLTRSILGGLLLGFGFSILDASSLGILLLIRNLFGKAEIINLYQLTPTFNLENLYSWFFMGEAKLTIAAGTSPLSTEPSVWISLLVLGVWIFTLTGFAFFLFNRQDITE